MVKKKAYLCWMLAAVVCFAAPLSSEELTVDSWKSWDGVNQFYKDRFLASLSRNEGVARVFQPREPSDSPMVSFWRGNKPDVTLRLNSVKVKFSFWREEQELFQDYLIDLHKDSIVVRPDPAYRKEYGNGVRFRLGGKESYLGFIDGRPGLVLFAVENHLAQDRLLALCPRFPGARTHGQRSLPSTFLPAHARPVAIDGSVEGFGRAGLETIRGEAYARIVADVTGNLPDSRIAFDAVRARNPRVSLLYRPTEEAQVEGVLEQAGYTPLGIRFLVELETPAGYRRISSLSDVVWHWMEEFPVGISFEHRGVQMTVSPGICSMLLFEKRKYELFSRNEPESESEPEHSE